MSDRLAVYLETFRPYSSTRFVLDEYREKSLRFNPDSLFRIFSIADPISALIPCDFDVALVYAVLLQNEMTSSILISCARSLNVRPL